METKHDLFFSLVDIITAFADTMIFVDGVEDGKLSMTSLPIMPRKKGPSGGHWWVLKNLLW